MCYLEDCADVVEYIATQSEIEVNDTDTDNNNNNNNDESIIAKTETTEELIDAIDLEMFFRAVGSIFITFVTSKTLNDLLLSKVMNNRSGINLDSILCQNSLLKIFSSALDMTERCKYFNAKYGESNHIQIESCIWNLSYFNISSYHKYIDYQYNHQMMMKMMITYICINGMHPFLGIDCDNAPFCQWSNFPKCKIRTVFEKLLANKDYYNIHHYDFGYRDAWKMRQNGKDKLNHNLLIDVQEMINFLFLNADHEDSLFALNEQASFDKDGFVAFMNEKFTLFTFQNECDFTYKIQFDIMHCDSLNIIDDFKISLFGNKIHFGCYPSDFNRNYWQKIKKILLGHQFVNIQNWYVICIKSIDTSIENVEKNNCYYLIYPADA